MSFVPPQPLLLLDSAKELRGVRSGHNQRRQGCTSPCCAGAKAKEDAASTLQSAKVVIESMIGTAAYDEIHRYGTVHPWQCWVAAHTSPDMTSMLGDEGLRSG